MIATTKTNLQPVFPVLNSANSKQACKLVKQANVSNKVLLGVTQGIGNVIMATPLIKALTSLNLTIDILDGAFNADSYAEKVLIDMPGVEVITEEQASQRIYLLGLQTIWPRIGIEKHCAQIRSAGNILHAWKDGLFAHEVEMNMSLAYSLGYKGEVPSLYCKYEKVIMSPRFNKDIKYVGIHLCRKYNHQFYANRALHKPYMIAHTLAEHEFTPVILGHKDCYNSQEDYPPGTIFLDGMKLEKTAGAMKHLDCMINEDSGIMHVTAAMDIPQVALFGPTSDIKNRPWSKKAGVIKQNLPCQPCQYTPNQNNCTRNVCMDISPEYIVKQVKMLIEKFPKNIGG